VRSAKAPIEPAITTSVQPARDGWFSRRDEPFAARPDGDARWPGGERVPLRAIYIGIACIVAAACLVETFSFAYDLARRGRPYDFWRALVLIATSGAMIIALLALPRHAAIAAGAVASRPLRTGLAVIALALAFSAAHIAGMVLLRKVAYAAGGGTYAFNWSVAEVLYELRKDLFSFTTIAITFWLAERAFGRSRAAAPREGSDTVAVADPRSEASAEFWLRDGRSSILIDPREVLWVASAGNYVEYALAGGRRHLIRTTLQSEEARLLALGIARVHRTRLVNLQRIVAVAWRPSGDFEMRLDSEDVIVGSRRYKTAVAGIGA
jgi:DNA-binding LytR/AlgR family response regulator